MALTDMQYRPSEVRMSKSRRRREELVALSGKRRWTEADGRAAVAALAASGLAVTEFAAEWALCPWRLYHWRTRLAEGAKGPTATQAFVPVRVASAEASFGGPRARGAPASAMVEVELARGRVLRVPEGFSPDAVARLVLALEGETRC